MNNFSERLRRQQATKVSRDPETANLSDYEIYRAHQANVTTVASRKKAEQQAIQARHAAKIAKWNEVIETGADLSDRLISDGIQAAIKLRFNRTWFPKQIAEGWPLYGIYRPPTEGEYVQNTQGEERTPTRGGYTTVGLCSRAEGTILTNDGCVLTYRGDFPRFHTELNDNGLTTKTINLPTPRYDRLSLTTYESYLDTPEELLNGLARVMLRYYDVADDGSCSLRNLNYPE
jgi:hypothetical protein